MATATKRKVQTRTNARRAFLALCNTHSISDDDRHAIISSITRGRTESVADPKRGKATATTVEIIDAIQWVEAQYGKSERAPKPRPERHMPQDADWVAIPHCPVRPGMASAATLKKVLAMARAALGGHWQERLAGLALGDHKRNPIPPFHRARAAAVAGGIGEQLAELPEREAAKVIQLLSRKRW